MKHTSTHRHVEPGPLQKMPRIIRRRAASTRLTAAILFVAAFGGVAGAAPVVLEGGSVDLSTEVVTQRLAPEIAYNSQDDEYMAVWFDTRNPSNNDVFGQRLDSDGTLLGSNFPVIEFAEAQIDPAISYSPVVNRYLAVWRTQQSGSFNRGRGRLLEADGSQVGPDFLIGNGLEMQLVYSPDADEWLSTGRSPDIRGRRVTSAGALAGSEIIFSSSGAPAPNGGVAYDTVNQRYLATFRNQVDERLEGRLAALDGTLIGGIFTISPIFPASGRAAAVAFDPILERYLVIYGVFQSGDLRAQFVDANGGLVGSELILLTGLPVSVDPALAYDASSGGFVAAWFDGVGVTVQSLTADGAFDGDPVQIASGTATGQARIVVGATNQFVVVWTDDRNGVPDVFAQRIRTLDPSSAPESAGTLRWISCAPNPVIEDTSVRFALSEVGRTMVEIVAPDGRIVRAIPSEASSSGEHVVEWDRTDDSGKRVAGGVYFLQMRGEHETVRGPKLIVIR
jgi:hypothetical protein